MGDDATDSGDGGQFPLPTVRRLLSAEANRDVGRGVLVSVAHAGAVHEMSAGTDGSGTPLGPTAVVPWTCSSKPVGAIAFARAWSSGALDPDDRVADHLPEYAEGGKGEIRVRDLLTHTTGVPDPFLDFDTGGAPLPGWEDVEALVWAVIRASEPVRRPGTTMIYNPIANWFTLDRVLAAATGTSPGESYRAVLAGMGATAVLGLPAAAVSPSAEPAEEAGLARMLLAAGLPVPGTGVWGTVSDLRLVGETVLPRSTDVPSGGLASAVLEAVTSTHWPGPARGTFSTTDFPYGMGFMTQPKLFGRHCSPRVHGHAGGNTSSLLVDPDADLVVAMYWNRRLGDTATVTRRVKLVDAVYHDLSLT